MRVSRSSREVSAYVRDLVTQHGTHDNLAAALHIDRVHVTRAVGGQRLSGQLLAALNMSLNPTTGRYVQSEPPSIEAGDLAAAKAEIVRLVHVIGRLNDTIRSLRAALAVATRNKEPT